MYRKVELTINITEQSSTTRVLDITYVSSDEYIEKKKQYIININSWYNG